MTVIITGAGTGIGQAIALRMAADGHSLGLLGRRIEPLEATAAMARDAGAPVVHTASCDIRQQTQVDEAVDRMASTLGGLHAFVANSGIGGANEDGPTDRFDDLVQTNLMGTYYCCRAAIRHFDSGPSLRHIVAVSSILGRFGVPGYTGYCASKTGILGLIRALALEVAADGIQVNAICPGWVDTAMAREGIDGMAAGMNISHDEAHSIAMQQVPVGRMSQPADVAGVVAWLLSPDARGVVGQGIDINGGAWMG